METGSAMNGQHEQVAGTIWTEHSEIKEEGPERNHIRCLRKRL